MARTGLEYFPLDTMMDDKVGLLAAERIEIPKDTFYPISLGVGMKLPEGYEAHIIPRSSTFANFGIIMANGIGVIDNSYCGDGDIWHFPAFALRDGIVRFNDRICQFRIVKKQPNFEFCPVVQLGCTNRGGLGSTGTK